MGDTEWEKNLMNLGVQKGLLFSSVHHLSMTVSAGYAEGFLMERKDLWRVPVDNR